MSTTLSNKKALDELNDSNEKTINFFKIIINKGSNDVSSYYLSFKLLRYSIVFILKMLIFLNV